jgi:hypothetical protein
VSCAAIRDGSKALRKRRYLNHEAAVREKQRTLAHSQRYALAGGCHPEPPAGAAAFISRRHRKLRTAQDGELAITEEFVGGRWAQVQRVVVPLWASRPW